MEAPIAIEPTGTGRKRPIPYPPARPSPSFQTSRCDRVEYASLVPARNQHRPTAATSAAGFDIRIGAARPGGVDGGRMRVAPVHGAFGRGAWFPQSRRG